MDESGGLDGGDPSEPPHAAPPPADLPEVIDIAEAGDLVLDLVFENSKSTLRSTRNAIKKTTRPGAAAPPPAAPKARSRVGFRVEMAVLRRHSPYFEMLLGDTRFTEARAVTAALGALRLAGVTEPGAAPAADLPWVRIVDDDAATRLALHREAAFTDLLRVLHGRAPAAESPPLDHVVAYAVLADRFDCGAAASKVMVSGWKLRWPGTQRRAPPAGAAGEEPRLSRAAENVLRQKILVGWLLNQPQRFQAATRELIMSGSRKWAAYPEQDGDEEVEEPTWWNLQDGLEQELQYRRECILNTIASIPRHFLGLYASRTRQCQLGYDSSAACDSYQLGEMVKFLANKRLLFLVDFGPASLHEVDDTCLLPIDAVLAALRQCPGYQIDKHHTNCGLRTRMLPALDFVKTLLAASSVPLARLPWRNDRQNAAWMPREGAGGGGGRGEADDKPFQFTRAIAGDQRLRYEHAMGADRFARDVFTASGWNWSSED